MPEIGQPIDEEAIYRQVGQLVIFFQMLETGLVSLASFAIDPENADTKARTDLSKLWFKDLTDRTVTAVAAFTERFRGDVPAFREKVDGLLERCRELARYRNKVVHSAYVTLEAGGVVHGVLRTTRGHQSAHRTNRLTMTTST